MNPGGRPVNQRRWRYINKFDLSATMRTDRKLSSRLMDQLDACKGYGARRVLLGIGRKKEQQ